MPKPSEQAPSEFEPGLDDAQVLAYLRAHPGFLARHAEPLAPLLSLERESGDCIVDLQRFMAERLRRRTRELEEECQQLLALARLNLKSQARIHRAVLALMGATSFEQLIQVTTIDLPVFLALDVTAICIETTASPPPRCETPGVRLIDSGAVDRLLGPARDMLLRPHARGERAIFGAGATLVRSEALLRLKISPATPVGLLALGARKDGRFHPGQGTELLGFLARAVEFSIRAWLDLPL